jgi:RNA-directed DNA polymerase
MPTMIDAYKRHDWLLTAVMKRLREEFAKLNVEINEEKSRIVDLGRGESFGFLGFDFRRTRPRRWSLASAIHAEAEEAHDVAAQAQGDVPTFSVATAGSGGGPHQPGVARLGCILDRALEQLLQLHQRLGGKEGTASFGASQ